MLREILEHYNVEINYEDKACCPFHQEKTPSFKLYEETESYYCYGCGATGDAIQFVRDIEGWEDKSGFQRAKDKIREITGQEVGAKKMSEDYKKEKEVLNNYPALKKEEIESFKQGKEFQDVLWRGIRQSTDEFFRCYSVVEDGKVKERHYLETNQQGKPAGAKSRVCPKDFSKPNLGNTGKNNQLYGQWRYKSRARYVLIVGGEEDVHASHQLAEDYQLSRGQGDVLLFHVVSAGVGEGAAHKHLATQIEFLDMHENIVLALDNDEAGLSAMADCLEILPKHKVSVVRWSRKDPLEMLQKDGFRQFIRDFFNMKAAVSTGIKDSVQAMEEVKEFLTAPKIPLPPHMHRIEEAHRGGLKSSGFIGNIIADTSVGKTFLTDSLLEFWIKESLVTPIIVSIERTAGEMLADLISIHLSKNLTWFSSGMDAVAYLEIPEVQKMCDNFLTDECGKRRFYIIDERDGSIENLQNQMMYASAKYGTDLFINDPLTDLTRSLSDDEQADHLMWQKQRKKNGWKIINVLHTRKPPTDKEGKTRKVTEYDAYGSGTFVQSADWNWVLNRDKMAGCSIERNTTTVDIPKVRGGTTGHAADLYYDVETRRQYDKEDYFNNK